MTRAYLCPVWQYSDYASLLCLDCTNKSQCRASCPLSSQYLTTHLPNNYSVLRTEVQRLTTTDHVLIHFAVYPQHGWCAWGLQGRTGRLHGAGLLLMRDYFIFEKPVDILIPIGIFFRFMYFLHTICWLIYIKSHKNTPHKRGHSVQWVRTDLQKTQARLVHVLQFHPPHPPHAHAHRHRHTRMKSIINVTDNIIII